MGKVVPYRPPRAREEATARIGMVIFLASWAMLFAALLLAYAFVRARSEAWPPPGLTRLPRLLPLANTVVLALSSACLEYGLREVRRARAQVLEHSLLATFVLGVLFLGLQALLWGVLARGGLRLDSGAYASVFYGLTWIHALHVAVGLVGLVRMARGAMAGEYNAVWHLPVRLWAMYWHFVGVVWVVMFVSIFLV